MILIRITIVAVISIVTCILMRIMFSRTAGLVTQRALPSCAACQLACLCGCSAATPTETWTPAGSELPARQDMPRPDAIKPSPPPPPRKNPKNARNHRATYARYQLFRPLYYCGAVRSEEFKKSQGIAASSAWSGSAPQNQAGCRKRV